MSKILYNNLTREPTGFLSPADVVINYDPTTQKVTLTGTITAYYRGTDISVANPTFVSGWVSAAHPNVTGHTYFLYYNGTAFVWADNSFPGFDVVLISLVNYDTTNKYSLRECHGLMNWQTHKELHETVGAYKTAGGTFPSAQYTLNSTTAANRRPDVDATSMADEDLPTSIPALTSKSYTTYNLTGASVGAYTLASGDIISLSTNNPYYNTFSTPNWGQTLMPANSVASVWVYAVPVTASAGSQAYRYIFVQPQWITQAQNSSAGAIAIAVTTEKQRNSGELNLGTLGVVVPELLLIGRIIIDFTTNWRLQEVSVISGNRLVSVVSPSGNYLSTVVTDATLTGGGTVASPLSVVSQVEDVIVDGVTTIAPSQNAVFDALASKQNTLVSATNIKTINGSSILGAGDLTVSTAGAVLTDQSTPQTIGLTGSRLAKLWTTDLDVTNTITGSISGNAGTATTLATSRALNGVGFNGSAPITIPVNNQNDTTTASSVYPLWTATDGGNYAAKVSTTKLSFKPSIGELTATTFVGALTGIASGNLTASNITQTITNGVTTNAPSEDVVYDALALKAPLLSPSFTTPSLGVATATSINGATITSGTLNGSVTGTNTGDQTSIVGISGTMAQFDTAVSDGNIVYQSQALGTPSSGTLTNCTFPTLNQDTTGKSAKTDALNSATTVINVSSATAPTTGQVLTATSSTAATWQTPSASGGGMWTLMPGTPTRVGNTSFTVTGDVTSYVAKGMIIKWTESSTVRVAMVSIPSTYGSPNTTITIIGDTMASIDASSLKYCMLGVEMFQKNFAVAGNIGAVATDVANAYYATEPMRVLGADLQVGTAGTTNSTTIDINIAGTTAFTTKPTLATTVATSPTPFTADTAKSLTLNQKVSIDIDAIQTTNAVDLYVQLYVLPTRYLNLS